MGQSNALRSGHIIDSASMLLGSKPQPPSRDAQQRQRAMQLRLAQLNAAMGQPDDIMQDPEFTPPPESIAKPAGSKIPLIIVALLAAIGWTALFSQTAQQQKQNPPAAPQVQAAAMTPAVVAQPTISDETAVNQLLKDWRSAWSQRDVAAYLGAYSQDFKPADGSSRHAWAAARTQKLGAGAPITLDIRQLRLDRVDADHFKASFQQDYAAGSYRETARQKSMLIAREGSAWRIVEERQH